ncbi:MAG: ABC transporter substrate-binding protein [Chloroflexota bacterium]
MKLTDRLLPPGAPTSGPARLSRRQILRLGGAVLGTAMLGGEGLLAAGCQASPTTATPQGSAPKTSELQPVKVGYLPITDATPLLVAHGNGLYEAEGLKAEQPTMFRSWSQVSEAFMARSVNVVHLLFPIPIYMRYSLQYPAKVVAWNHINGSAVTVRADGGIGSLADLGGKQIAIPHWYSQHNVVLQKALRTVGLEPIIQDRAAALGAKQTNLFVMNPPDMPTALGSGAVDGYSVAEPFNAAGEILAGGKILRFNGDVWRNHPCCVAVLHEEDIARQPEWSQRVVNAIVAAQRWCVEHKTEAAKMLSKDGKGYLPSPEAVVVRAMTKYDLETYGSERGNGAIRHPEWSTSRIGFQPYPYRSATEMLTTLLKETQLEGDARFLQSLAPSRVVEDLVNYDLVEKAITKVGRLADFEGVDPAAPTQRGEQFTV